MPSRKRNEHSLLFIVLSAAVLTVAFCIPFLLRSDLGLEHDTFFHLSRIEGLAQALAHHDFFPALYPMKNNDYGYASPLFYCDVLLYLPAFLYLKGLSLVRAYKLTVILMTFFACVTMLKGTLRITKKRSSALLGATAYLFANYHISDVYVRSALGETAALIFLPLLVESLYRILEEKDTRASFALCSALCGLLLSHNLSFLLGCLLSVLLVITYLPFLKKEQFAALCYAAAFAFLLTAFFSLPLIEQLLSQPFIVSYYANSDLSVYSMPLWKFFANQTVFGLGDRLLEPGRAMTVNIGWFLTFFPFVCLFLKKKDRSPFVTRLFLFGLLFLLLPGDWVPWQKLGIFSVLQFPWRLEMVALVLMSYAAAYGADRLFDKKELAAVFLIVLLALEGAYHLYPCTQRSFVLKEEDTYEDIVEGKIVDPYYSAFYKRVELAGGDYLPISSPDFRNRGTSIRDNWGNGLPIVYERDYETLSFTLRGEGGRTLILPLTYYKGYHVSYDSGSGTVALEITPLDGMVAFYAPGDGNYTVRYGNTLLRNLSLGASAASALLCVVFFLRHKK